MTQDLPQVWHFLQQHQEFLDIAVLPPLATLEAALFGRDPFRNATIAAVAVPLLRLLLQDIYHVCTDEYIERDGNEGQQRRDLHGGAPVVDEDTWPFAASATFAGEPLSPLWLRRVLALGAVADAGTLPFAAAGGRRVLGLRIALFVGSRTPRSVFRNS